MPNMLAVILSEMPKGVEHFRTAGLMVAIRHGVILPEMPKGVEHTTFSLGQPVPPSEEARGVWLSHYAGVLTPGSDAVILSEMPKGVEHASSGRRSGGGHLL